MAATKLQPGLGDALNICWLCGKFKALFGRNLVSGEFEKETSDALNRQKNWTPIYNCVFVFSQEYKPYMFWMNMIDAFYQSLVCFFIPYFVSTVVLSCLFPAYAYIVLFHPSLTLLFVLFLFFVPTCSLLFCQAYADSDVDLFTWGTPITTIALFTILVHLGIETKTWVRRARVDFNSLRIYWNHRPTEY